MGCEIIIFIGASFWSAECDLVLSEWNYCVRWILYFLPWIKDSYLHCLMAAGPKQFALFKIYFFKLFVEEEKQDLKILMTFEKQLNKT